MDFKDFATAKRRELMPSTDEMAKKAQDAFYLEPLVVEQNFNRCLKDLLQKEFEIYQEIERDCSTKIVDEAIRKGLLRNGKGLDFFARNYTELLNFFISLANSRKARAGKSFELHVRYLFEKLDYPFSAQRVLNGTVDYIIPSEEAFKTRRDVCVVLSLKRTLRERWRIALSELSSLRAGRIYILTADENIEKPKVEEMAQHNIVLVIWDHIKNSKFATTSNVIGYTQFFGFELPATKSLWQTYAGKR